MAHASFDGLRVLSLESRRAKEVAKLIKTYGGEPFVVPAMREVPLETNVQALEAAGSLNAGEFDLVVFMTGVGVRALVEIAAAKYSREAFLEALRRVRHPSLAQRPVDAGEGPVALADDHDAVRARHPAHPGQRERGVAALEQLRCLLHI